TSCRNPGHLKISMGNLVGPHGSPRWNRRGCINTRTPTHRCGCNRECCGLIDKLPTCSHTAVSSCNHSCTDNLLPQGCRLKFFWRRRGSQCGAMLPVANADECCVNSWQLRVRPPWQKSVTPPRAAAAAVPTVRLSFPAPSF